MTTPTNTQYPLADYNRVAKVITSLSDTIYINTGKVIIRATRTYNYMMAASCKCLSHAEFSADTDFRTVNIKRSKVFKKVIIDTLISRNLFPPRAKYLCTSCGKYCEENFLTEVPQGRNSSGEAKPFIRAQVKSIIQLITDGKLSTAEIAALATALGESQRPALRVDAESIVSCGEYQNLLEIDVPMWISCRNAILVHFLTGCSGIDITSTNKKSLALASGIGCVYSACNLNVVVPLSFAANLVNYFVSGSKTAVGINTQLYPCGSYGTIRNWIAKTTDAPNRCPTGVDVITAFDNNQVLGRRWRVSAKSVSILSVMTNIIHVQPSKSSLLQFDSRLSPENWLYNVPPHAAVPRIRRFLDIYQQTFEELRIQSEARRLEILYKEQSIIAGDIIVDRIDQDVEIRMPPGDPYSHVPHKHHPGAPTVTTGEPCFVNPCSFSSVQTVLEHIQALSDCRDGGDGGDGRRWAAVCCDGLPYVIAHKLMNQNKHLQNILLLPGLGHYEINMTKACFKLLWDVALSDLAYMLNYQTDRAQNTCKAAGDHHKSWQILEIFFEGTYSELMLPYVRQCVSSGHTPSVSGFHSWLLKVKNPNYLFLKDVVMTYLQALFLFRAGMRRNNSECMLAGRVKFTSLFYGLNMPNYQEIDFKDSCMRVLCPEDITTFLSGNEAFSVSGHTSKGEGVDFILESKNKRTKQWLPPGIPSQKHWLRVCRNIDYLENNGGKRPSKVLSTCVNHQDKVNCVTWIQNSDNAEETELVTGSVDSTAVVWRLAGDRAVPLHTLKGHSASIISVAALTIKRQTGDDRTLVVTTSVDSSVKIWSRDSPEGDFKETQSLPFGSGFCLDVSLTKIPNTSMPLLACGGDDQKIHLYTEQQGQFVRVIILPGHEDWVRGLDFTHDDGGDILLASCSQDYIIRIWRLSPSDPNALTGTVSIATLPKEEEIKMKEKAFKFTTDDGERAYAVILESVMCGHDNWIYSIRWQQQLLKDGRWHQPMCLLSASMDKTMILWRPDPDSGVWIEQVRVGEVGGNTLGLYGGVFSPDGSSILAHGYHGAFHQWRHSQEKNSWEPVVTSQGHFAGVHDLSWDTESGQFVVTVSSDQTTRLHAPWVTSNRQVCWYELARPQVHGYDLQCLAMINKYKLASGAEEKVIRVFDAPRKFLENFTNICDLDLQTEIKKHKDLSSLPEGASVPALGLSNKAVFQGDNSGISSPSEITAHPNEQNPEIYFSPVTITEPPTEEHLIQNALWPETQKLYGHGYEIFSLAADPAGKILASACKAAKAEYANIILWDTETWKQICSLEGASLTVTQLEFSHNGLYLLSVCRDRTWRVYKKRSADAPAEGPLFCLLAGVDKKSSAHSRIIWSGTWSHDDRYFFTASRDKKVMAWSRPDLNSTEPSRPQTPCSVTLDLKDAVTAVACSPVLLQGRYLISTGLESGVIGLYLWGEDSTQPWTPLATLDQNSAHHLSVKRLKFRRCLGQAGVKVTEVKDTENSLQLASCGSDWMVKVYTIHLSRLLTEAPS